ncbi:MAG: hypothetical protein MJ131_04020 [Lachnospiraceae bacterium]|nr:hypothetical protein [Lachnospiraceae bacterium]
MKKINFIISCILVFALSGCASTNSTGNNTQNAITTNTENQVPENIKSLQHKIDKAMEVTPSYDEIIEIEKLYNDLLKSEQEKIKDYDKILNMKKLDENDVECIFTVKRLKSSLTEKKGKTLDILSVYYYPDRSSTTVKVDYSIQDDYGRTEKDSYYYMVKATEEDGNWSCEEDPFFELDRLKDMKAILSGGDTNSAQDYAKETFERHREEVKTASIVQIMENIDIKINWGKAVI